MTSNVLFVDRSGETALAMLRERVCAQAMYWTHLITNSQTVISQCINTGKLSDHTLNILDDVIAEAAEAYVDSGIEFGCVILTDTIPGAPDYEMVEDWQGILKAVRPALHLEELLVICITELRFDPDELATPSPVHLAPTVEDAIAIFLQHVEPF